MAKKKSTNEIPEACQKYLINDVGVSIDRVVAHRHAYGEETKYVLLVENPRYVDGQQRSSASLILCGLLRRCI